MFEVKSIKVKDKGATLICEMKIRGETKKISFHRLGDDDRYGSDKCVYVQIPPDVSYENKVRKAAMYVQKVKDDYHWLTGYIVLNRGARIVCWIDSEWGQSYKNLEALDYAFPIPQWIE